ncbi:hypothetical protein ACFQNI_09660 [Salinirubellus salinus]|jgi:hypothetical protein|uniref:hypothetical protein n=1 Tax=Salinirubellus salinus TaxID=1364945 RepID=UPI003614A119
MPSRVGVGGGRRGRESHRRAFLLAGLAAVATVVTLALAFRWSAVDPPVWFGSTATFFACVAGVVAVPTFVVAHPRRVGTVRLARRLLVATLGGVVGAGLVLVTAAALGGTYDPMTVPMWLPASVGLLFVAVALLLS